MSKKISKNIIVGQFCQPNFDFYFEICIFENKFKKLKQNLPYVFSSNEPLVFEFNS